MDWGHTILMKIEALQWIYGVIAIFGGIARYLSSYTQDGVPFNFGIFLASTFVSGFSGWMFALVGISMALPQQITFVMAGTGGFMGDQTMKFCLEYIQGRMK